MKIGDQEGVSWQTEGVCASVSAHELVSLHKTIYWNKVEWGWGHFLMSMSPRDRCKWHDHLHVCGLDRFCLSGRPGPLPSKMSVGLVSVREKGAWITGAPPHSLPFHPAGAFPDPSGCLPCSSNPGTLCAVQTFLGTLMHSVPVAVSVPASLCRHGLCFSWVCMPRSRISGSSGIELLEQSSDCFPKL